MDNLSAFKDIEKISFELLKSSKALDIFPTPVNKIVAYSNLVVRADIDLSKVDTSFLSKAGDVLKRALAKVRGVLDRSEKTIYLDMSQGFSRKNFVTLHECGHEVLPWQRKFHEILQDDDFSLDPEFHEAFEAEANYFASVTLFQHDRFIDNIKKLDLSVGSAMHLAKHFGASVQATLRRYVECSKNRCALIVLENITPLGKPASCDLRSIAMSDKFKREFGDISLPSSLGYTWEFVKDYYHKRKFKRDGIVSLPTLNGEISCRYEFFNNSYRGLVFLYPLGEKKGSRIKVIVSGTQTP